jgi:hypothetical protein
MAGELKRSCFSGSAPKLEEPKKRHDTLAEEQGWRRKTKNRSISVRPPECPWNRPQHRYLPGFRLVGRMTIQPKVLPVESIATQVDPVQHDQNSGVESGDLGWSGRYPTPVIGTATDSIAADLITQISNKRHPRSKWTRFDGQSNSPRIFSPCRRQYVRPME